MNAFVSCYDLSLFRQIDGCRPTWVRVLGGLRTRRLVNLSTIDVSLLELISDV